MVSDVLRVGVVTGHVPLLEVPSHITKPKIVAKLQAMLQSLRYDFAIQKPLTKQFKYLINRYIQNDEWPCLCLSLQTHNQL
ncbi:MAG: hypothetical protein EAZ29_12825, partial [Runella slithyformis]